MKKILRILSILVILIGNFGCSDFLEESPYSKITTEEANSTPTLVYVNNVASLYLQMCKTGRFDGPPGGISYGAYYRLGELSADLAMIPGRQGDWVDGGNHQNLFFHTVSPSHQDLRTVWNDIYKMVGLTNRAIETLEELVEGGGGDYLLDFIYEIRAIRAFYYMHAMNLFGRVPIVSTTSITIADVVQSPRSEVFAFVRDELSEIISLLPEGSCADPTAETYGRITKDVAYFMMARLAINAPVYNADTWNDGKFTGGVEAVEPYITNAGNNIQITFDGATRNAWETVIYCVDQITASGYTLSQDWKGIFLPGNDGNNENIFILPNDRDVLQLSQGLPLMTTNYSHAKVIGGFGANGPCATVDAAYLFGGTFNPADSSYDFSSADPRWDMTYWWGPLYDNAGQPVPSEISQDYKAQGEYLPFLALPDYSTQDYGDEIGLYLVKWGGARCRKVQFDPAAATRFGMDTDADFVIYRYADALLLAAEAHYRLGETGEALDIVNNQIRARVNATPLTEINAQALLDERGLELAWESWRRDDQIRFGTYTEATLNKYVGAPHANIAGPWVYDATGYTTVYPIPQDVLDLNSNLTQNPGYTGG